MHARTCNIYTVSCVHDCTHTGLPDVASIEQRRAVGKADLHSARTHTHTLIPTLWCACMCTQDMLDIVDVEQRREVGKVDLHMGGFDLIWDGGPVLRFDKPTSLPSMLGE